MKTNSRFLLIFLLNRLPQLIFLAVGFLPMSYAQDSFLDADAPGTVTNTQTNSSNNLDASAHGPMVSSEVDDGQVGFPEKSIDSDSVQNRKAQCLQQLHREERCGPGCGEIVPECQPSLQSSTRPKEKENPKKEEQASEKTAKCQGKVTEYQTAYDDLDRRQGECSEQADSAEDRCNITGDKGMRGVMDMVSQVGLGVGAMTASGLQAACSQWGNISQALNGAITGFKGVCGVAKNSCIKTCSGIKNELSALNTNIERDTECKSEVSSLSGKIRTLQAGVTNATKECAGKDQQIAMATQAAGNMIGTHTLAQKCDLLTQQTPQTFCQANPSAAICVSAASTVNCSDPNTARTNPTCICQNDPRNSICIANADTANGTSASDVTSSEMGSNVDDALAAAGKKEFGVGNDPFSTGGSFAGASSDNQGGGRKTEANGSGSRGGGLGGGEGSASYGSNNRGGGGGGSRINTNILGSGGGGSGSGGGMAPRGGARGTSGEGTYVRNADGTTRLVPPNKLDLKAFMNSGRRGPASCSSAPGILACADTDIWKIVNHRYKGERQGLEGW